MSKREQLVKALARAGLDEYKAVKMSDGGDGVIVKHDYFGLYPDAAALEKAAAAARVAARLGYKSEPRGHKSGTLIYIPADAAE